MLEIRLECSKEVLVPHEIAITVR